MGYGSLSPCFDRQGVVVSFENHDACGSTVASFRESCRRFLGETVSALFETDDIPANTTQRSPRTRGAASEASDAPFDPQPKDFVACCDLEPINDTSSKKVT